MHFRCLVFLFFLVGINALPLIAQRVANKPEEVEADTSVIELIFAKKMRGQDGAEGSFLYLEGEVHFRQGDMQLWCDTAHRYPDRQIMAYGDVQMVQNDSIRIFSDSLFYDGITRKARLSGDVVLQDSPMTMFTPQLFYDLETQKADYPFGALVVTDSAQLTSKSGYYDANTNMAYFKDSVRLTDPNYKLFADSLAFDTEREIAYFTGPTYIFDEENMLYCEDGYFNNRKNFAELSGNPYYLKRTKEGYQKAKSDTIIYNGSENRYYLIGNAVYEDGEKEVRADTIVRDEDSEQFFFRGNPKFKSLDSTQSQTIDAKYSFYDSKTETLIFRDEVRVIDQAQVLVADSLDYSQNTHTGIARGRVAWQDTSSQISIFCGEAVYNDSTGLFIAKDRPIMLSLLDGDSLWLTADTLVGIKDSLDPDKKKFFAYQNAKLYKKDLQGLCDSLTYSETDSLFQFLGNPILWVDSVQFTADTVRATLSNKKIDKVFLYQNSLIVSSEEEQYFNQIKGKDMTAYFADNRLSHLDVVNSGEAVYYIIDEQKRYVGVNSVECTHMFMYFNNNQVDRIKFTVEPKATLYPMGQVNHESLRLKNFRWLEASRPKNKEEIIGSNDWSFRLVNNELLIPEDIPIDLITLPEEAPKEEITPPLPTPPDSNNRPGGKGSKMKEKKQEKEED